MGLILLIVGMFFFALRAARRRPSYDEIHIPELTPMAARALAFDEDEFPTGELPVVPGPSALGIGPEAVLSRVNAYIEERPAEVARVLREWADERPRESV